MTNATAEKHDGLFLSKVMAVQFLNLQVNCWYRVNLMVRLFLMGEFVLLLKPEVIQLGM